MDNILVVGHPNETDRYISGLACDSDIIPIHHTVSEIGMRCFIEDARAEGKIILLMDIIEFMKVCKDILVNELGKGGFRCLATSRVCPCDGYPFDGECRCSRTQKEKWDGWIKELDSVFKVVRL